MRMNLFRNKHAKYLDVIYIMFPTTYHLDYNFLAIVHPYMGEASGSIIGISGMLPTIAC